MTSLNRVYNREKIPTSHFVPSSGALNLSTFFSATQLASLLRLAATSRTFACSGASPSAQPSLPHRQKPLTPLPLGNKSLTRTNPVSTSCALDFEVLLRAKMRFVRQVLSRRTLAPLLRFRSSRIRFEAVLWFRQIHPLMTFIARSSLSRWPCDSSSAFFHFRLGMFCLQIIQPA